MLVGVAASSHLLVVEQVTVDAAETMVGACNGGTSEAQASLMFRRFDPVDITYLKAVAGHRMLYLNIMLTWYLQTLMAAALEAIEVAISQASICLPEHEADRDQHVLQLRY